MSSEAATKTREEILKARFAIEYIKKPLLERFLRYVKIHTTSDSKIGFTIDGDVDGSLKYENFNKF